MLLLLLAGLVHIPKGVRDPKHRSVGPIPLSSGPHAHPPIILTLPAQRLVIHPVHLLNHNLPAHRHHNFGPAHPTLDDHLQRLGKNVHLLRADESVSGCHGGDLPAAAEAVRLWCECQGVYSVGVWGVEGGAGAVSGVAGGCGYGSIA